MVLPSYLPSGAMGHVPNPDSSCTHAQAPAGVEGDGGMWASLSQGDPVSTLEQGSEDKAGQGPGHQGWEVGSSRGQNHVWADTPSPQLALLCHQISLIKHKFKGKIIKNFMMVTPEHQNSECRALGDMQIAWPENQPWLSLFILIFKLSQIWPEGAPSNWLLHPFLFF